ncbi:hypothetical protein [Halopiger aswanensis]|uniref:Uncharacterized protein n=1 Tax=Halopiger aswanensis TaxID=148449 RepID=A0A419WEK7_9EURY|nr:hypothetical protein [Halopiger aswanensis]RKD93883.1 hypothetical protein ATJ93_3518 [Halopiger aswanensis]
MYERTFGTDWDTLENRDEALRRAFALGVAECLGEAHPDERERLADAVETAYDRRFVDLAYRKGRQRVRQLEPEVDDGQQLRKRLADELTDVTPLVAPHADPESDEADGEDGDQSGLPTSLQGYRIDTLPDDSTERVRQPSFLERDRP